MRGVPLCEGLRYAVRYLSARRTLWQGMTPSLALTIQQQLLESPEQGGGGRVSDILLRGCDVGGGGVQTLQQESFYTLARGGRSRQFAQVGLAHTYAKTSRPSDVHAARV